MRPEILLHPNVPKPLHLTNPRNLMGQKWWDEQRKIAYASTNNHCAACGVPSYQAKYHKWLEAHELYEFDYPNGKMTFVEIVPLCHSCHNFIHSGRLKILAVTGQITQAKYRDILKHGNDIISANHLKRPSPPKKVAVWGKWRLVFDGKEYKGKFENLQDWAKYFNRQ